MNVIILGASPDSKDRPLVAAICAKFVELDTTSTSCLAVAATCWFAKTAVAMQCSLRKVRRGTETVRDDGQEQEHKTGRLVKSVR